MYSEKRKNKNYKYERYGFVDWENSDEKLVHKSCKGTFFEDSFLNLQPILPSTPKESEALLTPDLSSTDRSSGLRKIDKVCNINLTKLRENV